MTCPKCGAEDCYRDSADVGVGVMYGPHGCPCGWSEDPRFDVTQGPKTEQGYRVDQWGGLTPDPNGRNVAAPCDCLPSYDGCSHRLPDTAPQSSEVDRG